MKSHTMYWFIFVSTYIDIIYIDTYIYIFISSLYFVYIHIPLNKITKKGSAALHHPLLLAPTLQSFITPMQSEDSRSQRRALGTSGPSLEKHLLDEHPVKIPCIPLYIPTVFPIFGGAGFWLDTSKYHTPIFCFGWFHSSKICKEFNGLFFSGWKL